MESSSVPGKWLAQPAGSFKVIPVPYYDVGPRCLVEWDDWVGSVFIVSSCMDKHRSSVPAATAKCKHCSVLGTVGSIAAWPLSLGSSANSILLSGDVIHQALTCWYRLLPCLFGIIEIGFQILGF